MKQISVSTRRTLALLLAGFAAGCANGLLGAGGGIIIVLAVSRLLSKRLQRKNDAFCIALCVMLPISALSFFIYALRGHISTDGFGIFILPAIAGGILGGFLLGHLGSSLVKKLFAALMVISGILLIVR